MVNKTLLVSSLFFGSYHIYSFIYDMSFVNTLFFIGTATSILNHGTTIQSIKYLDRFHMVACIFYFRSLYLGIPILFFILAKYRQSNILHICSHASLTLLSKYI